MIYPWFKPDTVKNNEIIEIKKMISKKNLTMGNKVNELEKKDFKEGKIHNMIFRPWGNFITIEENENWKVKKIEINPGSRISLQLHKHRSEHWIVVSGIANVEIDDKFSEIRKNESIYVPKGCKHRLSNLREKSLIIIEIQSGSYLGEDDIIRFKDMYGRN